jgi:hypothetical protein
MMFSDVVLRRIQVRQSENVTQNQRDTLTDSANQSRKEKKSVTNEPAMDTMPLLHGEILQFWKLAKVEVDFHRFGVGLTLVAQPLVRPLKQTNHRADDLKVSPSSSTVKPSTRLSEAGERDPNWTSTGLSSFRGQTSKP